MPGDTANDWFGFLSVQLLSSYSVQGVFAVFVREEVGNCSSSGRSNSSSVGGGEIRESVVLSSSSYRSCVV